MDRDGVCYPGQDRIATESGLGKRAVVMHLADAERDGWVRRESRGTGRGWKRHTYEATVPDKDPRGGARRASAPRASAPHALEVVHDVQPNLSVEPVSISTSQLEADAREVLGLCNRLRLDRRLRKGLSGRPLKATPKRLSKIKARRGDGFSHAELLDVPHAFYDDPWEGRDRYDDPIYAFKDDATVQALLDKRRNGTGPGELVDLQLVAGGAP